MARASRDPIREAGPTLVGLPYDASSSFARGPALAPGEIRRALHSPSANLFSEDLRDLGVPGLLADAGDLVLGDDPEAARSAIEAGIDAILRTGRRPLALGGDHSVTYPVLRALGPRWPGLTIVQVDAHPDLYPEFEGDRYSHACPFARILEEGLATRLVQVGIRAMSAPQLPNVERFGVEQVDMRAWAAGNRPVLDGPVYVSIDIDGLDPAHAPGVSHREPGGLTVRELLTEIQRWSSPIVGADLVEFNPGRDVGGITAPVCAKLVKELAARMIE